MAASNLRARHAREPSSAALKLDGEPRDRDGLPQHRGLIGLALLVGGIAVMAAYAVGRDDDGYFNSDRRQLESAAYAITPEDIDLGVDEVDWAPDDVLGDVRVQVDGGDKPVFVGIGSDDDVDRYLGNVARDELIEFDGDNTEFDLHEGGAPRTPPG